jgi:hypothetical protein
VRSRKDWLFGRTRERHRSQIAGVLFDHVAVRIEHVVGSRCFRDLVLDQAVQLGAFRTIGAFD